MACKIIKDYVPISSKHRCGIKRRGFRGVTIHETGNFSKGADAKAHRNYYHNIAKANSGDYIGYHYFVDDKEAYLMHPEDEIAWTNGDGQGDGNHTTISIEICVNSDGNFKKARDNGAYVTATILKRNNIKKVIAVSGADAQGNKAKANLFQHRSWMNKNCPATIRNKGLWSEFVKQVQKELDALWGTTSTTTKKTPTKKSVDVIAKEVISGKWGNGAERKKKLTQAGYNYANVQAKVDELMGKTKKLKSITEIAKEVIAGKWGNGTDRKNRLTKAGYNYAEVQKQVNKMI